MRIFYVCVLLGLGEACGKDIEVRNGKELKQAVSNLADGDVVTIFPGKYPAGNMVSGVSDLTIKGSDPKNRPVFEGGNEAWHFTRTPGLTLKNIVARGQKGNGINLDDGGKLDEPVCGVTIENVVTEDTGPKGNFDGIKCSGLSGLTIRNCGVAGWGGQAIDFVGCKDSLITGCVFTGKEGFSQNTGPQLKGGSEGIVIEKCRFVNAGERPIQVGGSTGMAFFRPLGAKYEARDITIRDNVIEGGVCATAFTGATDVDFVGNRIVRPVKWIFRILQETKEEGFLPCGDVRIIGNEIIFRREDVSHELNIGAGTAPESFVFKDNVWHAEDAPGKSKPKLPVSETGGVYK